MNKTYCPLCQKEQDCDRKLVSVEHALYSFSLVLCNKCGMAIQFPPLPDERAKLYYSSEYNLKNYQKELAVTFEVMRPVSELRIDFISKSLGKMPGTCLDIGPGAGTMMSLFQERECEVFGIEPDQHAAQWMKEAKKLEIYQGFFDDFMNDENMGDHFGKYELVILSHVLEHIRFPQELLHNIRKLLVHGKGGLYIEVPNVEKPYSDDARWEHYCDPGHYYYYSPSTLQLILEKNNFTVERMGTDLYPPYFPIFCLARPSRETQGKGIAPPRPLSFKEMKLAWLLFRLKHIYYFPRRLFVRKIKQLMKRFLEK